MSCYKAKPLNSIAIISKRMYIWCANVPHKNERRPEPDRMQYWSQLKFYAFKNNNYVFLVKIKLPTDMPAISRNKRCLQIKKKETTSWNHV